MNIRSRTALAFVIPILAVACGSNTTTPGGGGGSTGSGTGSTGSGTGSTGSGTGSTGSGTGSTGSGTGSTGSGTGSTGSGTGSTGSTGSGTGSTGSGTGSTGSTGSGTGSSGTATGTTTGTTGASGTSGSNGDGGSGSSGSSGSGSDGGSGPATAHLDQTDQTIEGFGINDMYAAGLPSSLFDATNGIGLSILRVGMNTNGDGTLNDSGASADISMVKAAGGKVIGSVWSPPTNCKSNNNVNGGGQLCSSNFVSIPSNTTNSCSSSANSSCYNSWATTITSFASTNGLYAMSVANEPEFASCGANEPCSGDYPTAIMTANEMVAFIKVVGPMLQAKGIKVISPETSEWLHLWSNDSACGSTPSGKKSSDPMNCGCFVANSSTPSSTCAAAASATCASACTAGNGYDYGHFLAKDATAWAAFDIIGTHEYDSQRAFPWPSDVTAARKEVWQTEMSGVKWWPEQGPSCDINDGVVVAQWIHSALVVGEASAWLWWWWDGGTSAMNTNENLGNVQGCPSGGPDPKRHYTLGNFSKYIRPGYKRVQMTGATPDGVLLSAYTGSSKVVIVAINSNTSTTTVPITISGGTAPAMCTPYLTSSGVNLTAQTVATVTGGTFMASLVGPSVTTFVCQ